MTGFGKAAGELNGRPVSLEVSSVNHRYFDCSFRLPPEWASLEAVLRDTLRQDFTRGKITVVVNRRRGAINARAIRLDMNVAKAYIDASRDLGELLGKSESIDVNTLYGLEGVFYFEEEEEDLEAAAAALSKLLGEAAGQLNAMRRREGDALRAELEGRLSAIRRLLETVEDRLPVLNALFEERLRARVRELSEEAGVAEERLAIEVAVLAERGDVTEETVRLRAHLDHAAELFDGPEPSGRKLNFLAQELQREINTLGSKSRDSEVARTVLEMKAEVEKFREQVQNIE